jgi:two-component system chemotaxis sensor kinase CheA
MNESDLKVEEKKIGEILVDKGIVKEEDIKNALDKQTKIGEILTKEGKVTPNQLEKVVQQQEDARKVKESTSIRVDTHKLDKLMNLVGELVINQARVAQIASKKDKIDILELSATAETLDRITREIQEQIMKTRMIPIENTFNQFHRMVRDLALEKKKDIKLKILGKETELDKTLIELINDPLKHMIRNSVDHGIETIEEREALGKSPEGTIVLNAYHEAGNIVIEVSDDGKGLNKEKILSKAREKEIIPYDKELSEDEIYKLIFLPGFSTAEKVTEISGRGVGMDVVKNNISKLRGNIEIYTKPGEGTTFKIILPLTLAIIDGMLVKVGEQLLIIPLLSIVESIRPKSSDIKNVNIESEVVNVRGEYIPLIKLYDLFNVETECTDPSKALIVIVSMGKSRACLLVDDIIGQQQAVIKSLEENYKSVKGISGATILGDGTVAMILDIGAIIKMAASQGSSIKSMQI